MKHEYSFRDQCQFYDKEGKNIDIEEYGRLFEDIEYRLVKQECIGNRMISTVWLGLNHAFFKDQPLLIFETMVFSEDENDPYNNDQYRYSTLEEAEEGHKMVVEEIKKGTIPGPSLTHKGKQ